MTYPGNLPSPRRFALAGLIAASLLSGGAPAQDVSRSVRIKGGETVQIAVPGGRSFSLKFVAVVSDERCPARVLCAWANPPVLALEASAPGEPARSFEVSSGGPGGARHGRYLDASIDYADLLPVPQDPGEFAKLKPLAAYTAVLTISVGDAIRR